MQITDVEVTPTTLHLRLPYRTAYHTEGPVTDITAVFVRLETQYRRVAWGCGRQGMPRVWRPRAGSQPS